MFMGEYNHTIDAKGRLIIPSKFRESLGEEFVITKGLDGCLFVYDNQEWNAFEEEKEKPIYCIWYKNKTQHVENSVKCSFLWVRQDVLF